MTIFENTLLNLIFEKCSDKEWWIFNDFAELKRHWESEFFMIDQKCRFYAISVNDSKLNIVGFDALSESHYIDIDSVLISAHLLERNYEELNFG